MRLVKPMPFVLAIFWGLLQPGAAQGEEELYGRQAMAQPHEGGIEWWDEAQRIGLIQKAYGRLEEKVQTGGRNLTLEVSDFESFPRSSFDQLDWREVATLPGGWVINVSRSRQALTGKSQRVEWKAHWKEWPSFLETENARRLGDSNFAEVVEMPETLVGLTRFEVAAFLDGRHRSYRAAVLWLGQKGVVYAFEVLDHITQGVDVVLAVDDDQPLPGLGTLEFPQSPISISEPAIGVSCKAGNEIVRKTGGSPGGFTGHESGRHYGTLEAEFLCACSEDCSQTCTPRNLVTDCQEFGEVSGKCHKISMPDEASAPGSVSKGHIDGASCTVAVGCAVKFCTGCACGPVTVSVGIALVGTASVSYTTDTPGASAFGHSLPHQCNECALEEGDPDDGGDPTTDPDSPWTSPILLDLDGGNLQLTSVAEGVHFDIDVIGTPVPVAWTTAESGDAFLVLDRNRNGLIDDGTELFGPYSEQVGSDPPNGFQGLRVFDAISDLGGNDDGEITPEDGIFEELRLWIDSDHNGKAQAGELYPLEAFGVIALDLDYRTSWGRDRHGNVYRYRSSARLADGRRIQVIDVLLRKSPASG